MAYVLKQIGPIPSARDENHRQRLQSSHGLSLLSSDGAYIPSFRSVWTKYWKNAVEESDGGAAYEDKNRGWFASLMAVASGEGGGDNVTKEVRLRYAKAHLAFVLASLKMRSKTNMGRSFQTNADDAGSCCIMTEVGVFSDVQSRPFISLLRTTSDRLELLAELEKCLSLKEYYNISFARMVSFGPYCRVVAWNIPDGKNLGVICVYQLSDLRTGQDASEWILVSKIINKDCGLSRATVTDMAPFGAGLVYGLVISRVNGTVEIIVIPNQIYSQQLKRIPKRINIIKAFSLSSIDKFVPSKLNHDVFSVESCRGDSMCTLYLAGPSRNSCYSSASVWMLVSEGTGKMPLSAVCIGEFGLPSQGPAISSLELFPNTSCKHELTSIPAPTVKIAISRDGRYGCFLDYNGLVSTFEFDNVKSTSFKVNAIESIIQTDTLSHTDCVLNLQWTSSSKVAAVTLCGYLRFIDVKQRVLLSSACNASDIVSSEGSVYSIRTLNSFLFLVEVEELSPKDAVDQMIGNRKVDEAYKMVIQYDIKDDSTLKDLWNISLSTDLLDRLGNESINLTKLLIGRISDKEFVINAAATARIKDLGSAIALIEEGIERASSRHLRDVRCRLVERRRRLQTFAILCKALNREFSPRRFDNSFQNACLVEVAMGCARRNDLDCLLMLMVRHSEVVLPHRLKILDCIPACIDPSSYSSLLPAVPSSFFRSNCQPNLNKFFFLFDGDSSPSTIFDASTRFSIPVEDAKEDAFSFDIDVKFMKLAEEQTKLIPMVKWYISKALFIEKFSGRIDFAHSILDLGHQRCRDAFQEESGQALSSLKSIRFVSGLLSSAIYGGTAPVAFTLTDWCEVGLEGFISVLLADCDASEAMARWKKYIVPLIQYFHEECVSEYWGAPLDGDLKHAALLALKSHCMKQCAADPYKGLNVALVFAKASRQFFPTNERVFVDDEKVVNFVFDCIRESHRNTKLNFVDLYWSLYECLPVKPQNIVDKGIVNVTKKIERLHRNLVLSDIVSSYFSNPNIDGLFEMEREPEHERLIGCKIIDRMLVSVCKKLSSRPNRELIGVLMQLLVDASEIRNYVSPLVPVGYAETQVCTCLISYRKADLLMEMISLNKSMLFHDTAKIIFFKYIRESFDEDVQDVVYARNCLRLLAPCFPEEREYFLFEERLAACAHFISLMHVKPPYKLLRDNDHESILKHILSVSPCSCLDQQNDWRDETFATTQNHKFVMMHKHEDSNGLASFYLPGMRILELTSLLNCTTAMKCFAMVSVAESAILMKCMGAAACSFYSLLHNLNSCEDKVVKRVFASIAKVVSDESYSDTTMRLELSSLALTVVGCSINFIDPLVITDLISAYNLLELRLQSPLSLKDTSPMKPKSNNGDSFLVFQAAGLFAKGAKNLVEQAYRSSEIGDRSSDTLTIGRVGNKSQDDTYNSFRKDVLSFLARYNASKSSEELDILRDSHIVSWAKTVAEYCVMEATRIKNVSFEPAFDMSTHAQLAVTLMLEISDKEYVEIISTNTNQILEEKSAEALEQLAASSHADLIPDESLVQQLSAYGFSVNGSRRSVFAVRNESVAKALEWAMQHERDDDFELPLLLPTTNIRSKDEQKVDQVSIHVLRTALLHVIKCLDLPLKQRNPPLRQISSSENMRNNEKADDWGDDFSFKNETNLKSNEGEIVTQDPVSTSKLMSEGLKVGNPDDDCGWDDESFDIELSEEEFIDKDPNATNEPSPPGTLSKNDNVDGWEDDSFDTNIPEEENGDTTAIEESSQTQIVRKHCNAIEWGENSFDVNSSAVKVQGTLDREIYPQQKEKAMSSIDREQLISEARQLVLEKRIILESLDFRGDTTESKKRRAELIAEAREMIRKRKVVTT